MVDSSRNQTSCWTMEGEKLIVLHCFHSLRDKNAGLETLGLLFLRPPAFLYTKSRGVLEIMPWIHKQKKITCASSGTESSWSPVVLSVLCPAAQHCNLYHTGAMKSITAPASGMRLKKKLKNCSLNSKQDREGLGKLWSTHQDLLFFFSSFPLMPSSLCPCWFCWRLGSVSGRNLFVLTAKLCSSCSDLFLPLCCDAVMILPEKWCSPAMNPKEFNTD